MPDRTWAAAAVLLCSASAGLPAAAQQAFDANAAFLANELNPLTEGDSTFGPFSVGYFDRPPSPSGDLPFAPFEPFRHTNEFGGDNNTQGFELRQVPDDNVTAAAVNVSPTNPGFSGLAPGEILLVPGNLGPQTPNEFYHVYRPAVRFTAPAAGTYNINGNFRSLEVGGNVGYQIEVNGFPTFSELDTTNAGRSVTLPNVTLAAGDTVDFAVSEAGDYIIGDQTGLTASLALVPEPASLGLLALGGLGLLARRRRA